MMARVKKHLLTETNLLAYRYYTTQFLYYAVAMLRRNYKTVSSVANPIINT
jgi:hypothetical protein